jgi:hypothetical protein
MCLFDGERPIFHHLEQRDPLRQERGGTLVTFSESDDTPGSMSIAMHSWPSVVMLGPSMADGSHICKRQSGEVTAADREWHTTFSTQPVLWWMDAPALGSASWPLCCGSASWGTPYVYLV